MNVLLSYILIYIICSKEKDLVQTLSCLSMIITPAFAEVSTDSSLLDIYILRSIVILNVIAIDLSQLKQQDENNATRNRAIEELEKSIAVAEAACPGITDKMVKKLIEKFQK